MLVFSCPFSTATLEVQSGVEMKALVLICPGGAYSWLSPREMWPVGKAFLKKGYGAAILSYSVGEGLGTLPLREAGWAVKTLKDAFWGLPVVIVGFSAGGHLAASLAVHAHRLELAPADAAILCYPVISSGRYAHAQSIANLGEGPNQQFFSLERWVDEHTPPVFLWHTAQDEAVPVQNSILFANALIDEKRVCALHIYPFGVHGLSLATEEVEEPAKGRFADKQVATWFDLCIDWLASLHLGGQK